MTRRGIYRNNLIESSDVISCTLLGTRKRSKPDNAENRQEEVIYSITQHNSKAKLQNAALAAAQILSSSRCTFYSIILFILSCLSPRLAQLAYIGKSTTLVVKAAILILSFLDTDSMYLFTHFPNLVDNVRPEKRDVFERHRDDIFERSNSDLCQVGKMKSEGIWSSGYFRTLKTYLLIPHSKEEERVIKAKGTPRSVNKKLEIENFISPLPVRSDREEKKREAMTAFWSLRPTAGFNMCLSVQTRIAPSGINYKRYSMVGE